MGICVYIFSFHTDSVVLFLYRLCDLVCTSFLKLIYFGDCAVSVHVEVPPSFSLDVSCLSLTSLR